MYRRVRHRDASYRPSSRTACFLCFGAVLVSGVGLIAGGQNLAAASTPATPARLNYILSTTFPNVRDGWLTGVTAGGGACATKSICGLGVRSTVDGGKTWRYADAPPALSTWFDKGGRRHGVSLVRFANLEDGWIYQVGMWATTDGGRTWRWQTGKPVVDVQPGFGNVWALEDSCLETVHCPLELDSRSSSGAGIGRSAWTRISVLPRKIDWLQQQPALMRLNGETALLIDANQLTGRMAPYVDSILYETRDGGRTWHQRLAPCASAHEAGRAGDGYFAYLGSSGKRTWLLCGSMAGGMQYDPQPKALYVSQNFGVGWRKVSEVGITNGPPRRSRWASTVPEYGDISGFDVSGSRMWMALNRGGVWTSVDGGRNWYESLPYPQPHTQGAGISTLDVVNENHAFAISDHDAVFRTSDGGKHWSYSAAR